MKVSQRGIDLIASRGPVPDDEEMWAREHQVWLAIGEPIKPNEFDALVCCALRVGLKLEWCRLFNAGDRNGVAEKLRACGCDTEVALFLE